MLFSLMAPLLPPNVKFILTARPEACCGGIRAALVRAFPGGVIFLSPQDVRGEAAAAGPEPPSSRVLVYDTVVTECELAGLLPAPPASGATVDHLRAAYFAVFERCPPKDNVAALLELLLAAQEPLSTSWLQQLGFGASVLRQLPGWGCLFFESEHRVHMLHKSLSDWLRLDNHRFAPSVVAGHKALGASLVKAAYMASDDAPASDYCLKYAVLHLCQAGPACAEFLDVVLSRWDFLRAIFKAGHGGRLLAALGAVPADSRSAYADDTYRWLARLANDFESEPSAMEKTTVADARCPVSCMKFREAAERLKLSWIPRMQLDGYGNGWPPDISTLKVTCRCVGA